MNPNCECPFVDIPRAQKNRKTRKGQESIQSKNFDGVEISWQLRIINNLWTSATIKCVIPLLNCKQKFQIFFL